MKRLFQSLFFCLFACCLFCLQTAAARTRDNISGQYILRYSNVRATLNVQLLSNNKIKFSLIALLYSANRSARNGTAEGTVDLKGNMAIYQEGECRITMKFLNNRVVVTESNVDDCGFGAFVTAKGTYLRKSRRPGFDS